MKWCTEAVRYDLCTVSTTEKVKRGSSKAGEERGGEDGGSGRGWGWYRECDTRGVTGAEKECTRVVTGDLLDAWLA